MAQLAGIIVMLETYEVVLQGSDYWDVLLAKKPTKSQPVATLEVVGWPEKAKKKKLYDFV